MSEYMNIEALSLRAERADAHARRWRTAAYVLLILLLAQTWLVVDTAIALQSAREYADAANADAYLHSSRAVAIDDKRIAAEREFKSCLAANAGLVDAIREFDLVMKDQQKVIRETLELAKRCDAQPSSLWAIRLGDPDNRVTEANYQVSNGVHLLNDLFKGPSQ